MASVWYIGTNDRRVISKEDWLSLGEDQETSTWDKFNGFSLPQSDFSASEVEKLRQMGFQPDSPDGPRPGSAVVPNETGEVTQAQLAAAIAALANSYAPVDPTTGMVYGDPVNPDLPTSITVDGVTTVLTYDAAGNLTSKKRGAAATKTVTYDGQGRMTEIA